jgi:hypothetical protein
MRTLAKRAAAGCLTALISFAILAATPARADARTSWTVSVHTSGGFAAIGRGTVTVSSNGRVVVETAAPRGQAPKRCVLRAAPEDLAAIRDAVTRAQTAAWAGKTFGAAAPDAMTYKLELQSRGRRSSATWYDNSLDQVPESLRAVYMAVDHTWQKANESCAR